MIKVGHFFFFSVEEKADSYYNFKLDEEESIFLFMYNMYSIPCKMTKEPREHEFESREHEF